MKLAWITDPHLDCVRSYEDWWDSLDPADAYLITGDIANGKIIDHVLDYMSTRRTYFVLGNHDHYHDSHRNVRKRMAYRQNYLTLGGPRKLTNTSTLVGTDGWYDGRFGIPGGVELADFSLIEELKDLSLDQRLTVMRSFADKDADLMAEHIHSAMYNPSLRHLYVATHVPPFEQSAWHEGKLSDHLHTPYFASKVMGESILRATAGFRECGGEVTVLCGHSHSEGVYKVATGLTVHTGSAVYGHPRVYRTLEIS